MRLSLLSEGYVQQVGDTGSAGPSTYAGGANQDLDRMDSGFQGDFGDGEIAGINSPVDMTDISTPAVPGVDLEPDMSPLQDDPMDELQNDYADEFIDEPDEDEPLDDLDYQLDIKKKRPSRDWRDKSYSP